MILINNEWEKVETQEDCIRLIQEYMGEEFTRTMKEVCLFSPDKKKDISEAISDVDDAISEIQIALNYLQALIE